MEAGESFGLEPREAAEVTEKLELMEEGLSIGAGAGVPLGIEARAGQAFSPATFPCNPSPSCALSVPHLPLSSSSRLLSSVLLLVLFSLSPASVVRAVVGAGVPLGARAEYGKNILFHCSPAISIRGLPSSKVTGMTASSSGSGVGGVWTSTARGGGLGVRVMCSLTISTLLEREARSKAGGGGSSCSSRVPWSLRCQRTLLNSPFSPLLLRPPGRGSVKAERPPSPALLLRRRIVKKLRDFIEVMEENDVRGDTAGMASLTVQGWLPPVDSSFFLPSCSAGVSIIPS